MNDSRLLFEEYAQRRSEKAFRELVDRYVNMVHSTACRLVNGDSHLAEDITQTVFLNLARNAGAIAREAVVGGWLHQNTCFVAANTIRGNRRRQNREQQAVELIAMQNNSSADLARVAGILDDAINHLGPEDRTAIMLRFFEQRDFRSVGQALGTNEDAARMRVNRALEKLHTLLTQRGAALTCAALGAALAAETVKAAPVGLSASVAAATLGTLAGTNASVSLLKTLGLMKMKIAAIVLVAGALAVPAVWQYSSVARLRVENERLRSQNADLAGLKADNERLSNQLFQAAASAVSEGKTRELARLRAQLGHLIDETNRMARLVNAARGNQNSKNGKRQMQGKTMEDFAIFIGQVLNTPVSDQTGLTGNFDLVFTPPPIGREEGKLDRVKGILLTDLGLNLIPYGGPFTPVELAVTNNKSNPLGETFALVFHHSDAPGLAVADTQMTVVKQGAMQVLMFPGPDDAEVQRTITCIERLRIIDSAKQQWALEHGKTAEDTPIMDDLKPYLATFHSDGNMACPDGGIYTIHTVGEKPTCTTAHHELP